MHYISADVEGMSGFVGGAFDPAGRARLDKLQRLHIAAAAAGLREGGAQRILAKSFHGMPDGLPEWVEPVVERPPGEFDLPCLKAGADGLVLIGFHGVAGTEASGPCYRYDHLVLNCRVCGEITIQVMLAASRGVPTAMLAGDRAAVEEVRAAAPAALTVTTREGRAVDEGGPDEAVLRDIRDTARRAAELRGRIAVPELPRRFRLEVPMRTELQASLAAKLPEASERDGLAVACESADFTGVYRFLLDTFRCCDEAKRTESGNAGAR